MVVSKIDLTEDFDTYGLHITEELLLETCISLCDKYELTGEQLAVNWLAYAASNECEQITSENIFPFERDQLQIKNKKEIPKDEKPVVSQQLRSSEDDDLLVKYGASPANSARKRCLSDDKEICSPSTRPSGVSFVAQDSPGIGTPSQRYSSRNNSQTVVCTFNEDKETSWKADATFTPQVVVGQASTSTDYMFEKLRLCGTALEDTLIDMADQLKDKHNIDEWTHVHTTSNEDVWCVGRVCCDSVGRLNSASVLLEGCREISNGSLVKVDLSKLPQYSLFPGQIIAVKGINPSGQCLIASQIIPGDPLPSDNEASLNTSDVIVKVACGPFTTTDNLLFEPLHDLLNNLTTNPPHVLILIGPILDVSHKLLCQKELTETYDIIVGRCIDNISSQLQGTCTQVYVVASSNDACSDFIYPTPALSLDGIISAGNKVKMLSDPVLLDVEGVTIGITATDVLMHLSKEEISFPAMSGDRFGRLSKHLLFQQSFYPLYPAPENFAVSYPGAAHSARLAYSPDILILPSNLRFFIKKIDDSVVVNPERLAKGLVGGSYANICIKAKKKSAFTAQIIKI